MAYAQITDLNRFLENFGTNYYGSKENVLGTLTIDTTTLQQDIDSAFDRINTMIDSIGRVPIVPIGTNVNTGSYHPYLIEWNCNETIFTRLKARHSTEYKDDLPKWMMSFKEKCDKILDDIVNGRIALDTDTTSRGIGYPITYGTFTRGYAKLFSNWDIGYYTSSDFPKTYNIRITGTDEGNTIGSAEYSISKDGGFNYESGTHKTGTSWQHIEYGLQIRWGYGSVTGTLNQLELSQEWQITCIPVDNKKVVGNSSVFKRFGRG